ncbi:PREDICTED: major facilitator superfamily domain-containing protein 1-like [Amphimedon queenslandica]|uniref:Lysosomal dipeptide transporter MFSD1 n=1 Tax=Amphimedon queenslandica TaxID=400682 RepID=A0A1X7TP88_AMPQE|nr:PREDICTED: major facilitator superfamily domain-containing protein 1-like [Amphimedon queenslandica]|eukprot:XP_003390169.2 PREDICTED: major facilitator superfamily domain-containing protein 1-like [Amphimedon queenslandica]
MGVTTAEYALLFSVSAWSSTFLGIVGGVLIDKLVGLRLGLLIVVSSILMGQIVWSLGGIFNNYFIMLAGRFFIGIGNDLVLVIDNAFKAIWFKEDLSLAIAIDIGFGRIGGTLAILLPQLIYDSLSVFDSPTFRLGVSLLTAAGFMIIGLIFTIIIFLMDYFKEKSTIKSSNPAPTHVCGITKIFTHFPPSFWLAVGVYVTYVPTIYSFVGIGQGFFIQKYGLSMQMANLANSLLYGSGVILIPFVGFLMNRTGFHLYWLLTALITTTLPPYFIFMFSKGESYIPLIAGPFYSLSYTLCGPSFVVLIPLIIDKKYLATAYGIQNSSFNATYSLLTYITGLIIDTVGYFVLQGFFMHIIILCIDFTLIMVFLDAASDNPKLNIPALWLRNIKDRK